MSLTSSQTKRHAQGSRGFRRSLGALMSLVSRLRPGLGLSVALTVISALTIITFRKQLFDHWTFPWDFVGAYSATPAFVAATIGHGHFLSWSPFVASGFPVDVDPQAGIYFPGWWLLGALHIPLTLRALTTVQVFHVLFGSAGVLFLAKARRLGWSWAMVAAVAYLFFGGFYGEAEHSDIVRGFAYLPWLLWALTPQIGGGRWLRIGVIPPLAWLIASGAYPGELVSFAITGLVYLSCSLWISGRETWSRYKVALLFAAIAACGVCIAVLLPYLRAEHAHELVRVMVPTAAVRAGAAISLRDLAGLYLNNFAWTSDGTVTSWAVGIPVLIGLACARKTTLVRQAPLIAVGVVALLLGMTPKIGVIGRGMVSLDPLFSSRFPAADYKAVVAIALIVVSVDAWSQLTSRSLSFSLAPVLMGGVLFTSALLVPATYGKPTYEMWLLILTIACCLLLVAMRLSPRLLVCLLVVVVAVDGTREIHDYRLLGHISPWKTPPSETALYRARDVYVRKLPELLEQTPSSRVARVAPYASFASAPTGTDPDASGWMADGYHLNDYGGTIERVLWKAEHNPALLKLLLAPWSGYTFPCDVVGCDSGAVHLPAPATWRTSSIVHTLAYSAKGIVYSVNTSKPVLLVENELALNGWHTSAKQVSLVDAKIPLRTWRLSPGDYQFTATFREPGRTLQEIAVLLALAFWSGCILALRRTRTVVDEDLLR